MYVEASVKIKSPVCSFVVPSSSIVTTSEGNNIVSVVDSHTKFINIKEGITNKGKTEIFGDLKGGEILLKNPSTDTKEGTIIN